jgi:hypothetical protein
MSKIEVNTVDVQCGSTLTLGSSGKTVTLASGASQSGFGRTGTVDWCTTAKTSPFTAVNGNGYFVNTTSGAVTVTLPASPSAGDIVAINDYARTFATNNVTICRNSSKMCGNCANTTLDSNGTSISLVYVDGTKGWKSINDDAVGALGASYVTATGGTITTCGDYKIHTFTSDATFCVSNAGNAGGSNKVSYVVVAGGAGGAGNGGNFDASGGGGAGGFREGKATSFDSYTASPLVAPDGLPVSVQGYPITVGAGGAGGPGNTSGSVGSNSVFSTITSAGGGGGAISAGTAGNGGSGGGGGGGPGKAAGTGNTPPVSPAQGFPGGTGHPSGTSAGGGGGGATVAGADRCGSPGTGGPGGDGATTEITGSPVTRAGGGGGGTYASPATSGGSGGAGGGGDAGKTSNNPPNNADSGTANTGGGGGGGGTPGAASNGGAGGSGVVIIRYKFQN